MNELGTAVVVAAVAALLWVAVGVEVSVQAWAILMLIGAILSLAALVDDEEEISQKGLLGSDKKPEYPDYDYLP